MTTYFEATRTWDNWCEYADPQGTVSQEEYEAMTTRERIEFMVRCCGPEWFACVIGTIRLEDGSIATIEFTGENLRVNGHDTEIACLSLYGAIEAAGAAWADESYELRLIENLLTDGPESDPETLVCYAYDEQAKGWHVATYSGQPGEIIERYDSEKTMFPVDVDAIDADQENVLIEELRAAFPSARIVRK